MWLKKLMHKWFGWEYVRVYDYSAYKIKRVHYTSEGIPIVRGDFWRALHEYSDEYKLWIFKNK
jgi:hypothetical protein